MTYVTHLAQSHNPDEWIFEIEFHCKQCGTSWRLSPFFDTPASFWRWFMGVLPRPKVTKLREGFSARSTYIVKNYPAETGISGVHITVRCPRCGTYAMRRKP